MRIFLAVFPPPEVRAAAAAAIARLRRRSDGVSWVREENLHYTLRFLGEIGDDGLRRAGEAAREAAALHPAFAARLGGLGVFPSPARARVLWLGMSAGAEALVALGEDVAAALERRGFAREGRPFAPHLTIGRVRNPRTDWSEALAAAPVDETGAAFRVERVLVIESTLSPTGSRYDIRAEGPLGAPGGG